MAQNNQIYNICMSFALMTRNNNNVYATHVKFGFTYV